MGTWDKFADRQFAKDESGRLVFLPRGPHRPAYFIDSTDENKLKSLVKVYGVAAAIINLTGSVASLAFYPGARIRRAFRSAGLQAEIWPCGLRDFLRAPLHRGPALLLWNVYRRVLDGLCSSLTTVDLASL
jgi:hypothetical protein